MKQGRASRDGREGWKVEPRPRAIIPAGVAQYGQAQGRHTTEGGDTDYHGVNPRAGKGYRAPMDSRRQIFPGGSQRRS